jgi:hypothetical protein
MKSGRLRASGRGLDGTAAPAPALAREEGEMVERKRHGRDAELAKTPRREGTAEERQGRAALRDEILAHQRALRARHGELSDSTPGIRAERDARG